MSIINAYVMPSVDGVNTYQNIVSRLSIFYLGSIVTMTIYTYNTKQKLSTVEFLKSKQPIIMVLGIIFSFTTMITVPQNIYVPKLQDIQLFTLSHLLSLAVWSDILSVINGICFFIATFIFLYILKSFINSFFIEKIIKKNYDKVIRVGNLKKFININQPNLKVKLNEAQATSLMEALEVFNQNLIYLLDLNNSKLIKEYILKWTNALNYINLTIFHTKYNPQNDHFKKGLYEKTLELTNNLIIYSSTNVIYKKENTILLNALLRSLPGKEEFFEDKNNELNQIYEKNYNDLSPIYFIELFNIVTHLYSSSNKEIYSMLLNGELEFEKIFIYPEKLKVMRNFNSKTSHYLEDVFLSILLKIIDTKKSDDLPIVLALLFSSQTQQLSKEPQSLISENLLGDLTQKVDNKNTKQLKNNDLEISSYSIKFIIVAITKACEIENYKAAGYLVKRVCNHVYWNQIEKELVALEKEAFEESDLSLYTSKISLNSYSLRYCFQKAILLLSLQKSYNSNYTDIPSIDKYLTVHEQSTIIDSLKDRKKDYGLPSINEDLVEKYTKESHKSKDVIIEKQ